MARTVTTPTKCARSERFVEFDPGTPEFQRVWSERSEIFAACSEVDTGGDMRLPVSIFVLALSFWCGFTIGEYKNAKRRQEAEAAHLA